MEKVIGNSRRMMCLIVVNEVRPQPASTIGHNLQHVVNESTLCISSTFLGLYKTILSFSKEYNRLFRQHLEDKVRRACPQRTWEQSCPPENKPNKSALRWDKAESL